MHSSLCHSFFSFPLFLLFVFFGVFSMRLWKLAAAASRRCFSRPTSAGKAASRPSLSRTFFWLFFYFSFFFWSCAVLTLFFGVFGIENFALAIKLIVLCVWILLDISFFSMFCKYINK